MLNLALTVRFILELCLLTVAFWAASSVASWPLSVLCGVMTTLVVAAVWGILLSPKRRLELGAPQRLLLELMLFAGAAWLLFAKNHRSLAAALLIAWVIDKSAVEWLQRQK